MESMPKFGVWRQYRSTLHEEPPIPYIRGEFSYTSFVNCVASKCNYIITNNIKVNNIRLKHRAIYRTCFCCGVNTHIRTRTPPPPATTARTHTHARARTHTHTHTSTRIHTHNTCCFPAIARGNEGGNDVNTK